MSMVMENSKSAALLRRTPGGVGHGRNQMALGPDGLIYVCMAMMYNRRRRLYGRVADGAGRR